MLGITIHYIQHSQTMLERGVCELAHSFFHFLKIEFTVSTLIYLSLKWRQKFYSKTGKRWTLDSPFGPLIVGNPRVIFIDSIGTPYLNFNFFLPFILYYNDIIYSVIFFQILMISYIGWFFSSKDGECLWIV